MSHPLDKRSDRANPTETQSHPHPHAQQPRQPATNRAGAHECPYNARTKKKPQRSDLRGFFRIKVANPSTWNSFCANPVGGSRFVFTYQGFQVPTGLRNYCSARFQRHSLPPAAEPGEGRLGLKALFRLALTSETDLINTEQPCQVAYWRTKSNTGEPDRTHEPIEQPPPKKRSLL